MFRFIRQWFLCILTGGMALGSCIHPPNPTITIYEPQSSWEIIRDEILVPKCANCHAPGTDFARQSDLILTADQAYEQLVNRQPNNPAARKDGLELLGTKGLESLYFSFFWEKINAPDFEHFYGDHPEYGELMPWGGPPLTNGELAYIKKWIIAGAPQAGFVADENLLSDQTMVDPGGGTFQIPPPPEQGIQLRLGPFDVAPHYEREVFYYQPLRNPEPVYIKSITYATRPGCHHFILYNFPLGKEPNNQETIRDLRNQDGRYQPLTISSIQDRVFFHGTQWRYNSFTFPSGVAFEVPVNGGFDMNAHYLNQGDETMVGEVYANLGTVDASEVQHIAKGLFLNNKDIKLSPGIITTLKKDFIFEKDTYILMMFSHAHEFMVEFKVLIAGGARDG
ncbi:MAG: hypothetical protein KDD63_24690, partial [Bacteroidetes bacterium]|nr:hypothetical protein [Bacteroidota bacterium]